MNDQSPLQDMKQESTESGKDQRSRNALILVVLLWLLTLAILIAVGWNAYFSQKEKTKTLAQQIQIACERGTFGPPDFTVEDAEELCNTAKDNADAPLVIEGPPGPPGPDGSDGIDGTDGTDGANGANGRNGRDGRDGDPGSNGEDGDDGLNGADGAPGETGASGPAGPPGPQGEQGVPGQDGTDGTNGTNGTNGADAVPFTFSFTIQQNPVQSTTYICTITAANTNVVCQEQE